MVHVNLIYRIYRLLNLYVLFHVNVQSLAVDHTGFPMRFYITLT